MAVVVFERQSLSKEQLCSLRTYILTKRKRENERPAIESKKIKTLRHNKPSNQEETSTRPTSQEEGTLKDNKEQLSSLKEKLELLKKEKHNLFQELKKVLHEEEEKRKKEEQLQQQQIMSSSDYRHIKSSIRPSWGLLTHETPPNNKYGTIDQLRYQTQFNQQRINPHTTGYGYHGIPMTGAHSFTGGNISSDFYHNKDTHSYSHYYTGNYRSGSYQTGIGGSGGHYFTHSMVQDVQQPSVNMYTHQQMTGSRVSAANEFSSSGQYPYDPRQIRYPLVQPTLHKESASKHIKK